VNVTNQGNQITLIVSHNSDFKDWTSCICNYDVKIKMSHPLPDNYHLKVYYAGRDMKCDEVDFVYNDPISIVQNKKTSVIFNSAKSLPIY